MNEVSIINKNTKAVVDISLPASKSESNRLLIIKALCPDKFAIRNLSEAEDTQILKALLEKIAEGFSIEPLDCKDAATVARFLISYLSLSKKMSCIVSGSKRLCQRPMHDLVDSLNSIGAKIEYLNNKGFLPVKISTPDNLKNAITIKCNTSSQFASSLLLVAPALSKGLNVCLEGQVVSAPYINLTLGLMSHFGISYEKENNNIFIKHQNYKPKNHIVESDWSAAAFWYQMAALSANFKKIHIGGLKDNSLQGDSILSKVFSHFGVKTTFDSKGLLLTKTKVSKIPFLFDFSNNPDIFPSIALTTALLRVPAHFTGLQNLAHKESDRLQAVVSEAKKFNLNLNILNNNSEISIKPQKAAYKNSIIDTYNDHRIAMAFAACAPAFENIRINNPAVVGKSYPNFWQDLEKFGFVLKY